MVLFANRFLSFYDSRAIKEASYKHTFFLWPVWVWKVLAPISDQHKSLNIFQRTILGLIQAGKTDAQEIADWMGLEKELVVFIYASQLQPNGWVDTKGQLTTNGENILDSELDKRRELKTCFIFQDAITGQLWPRVITEFPDVEPTGFNDKGFPEFQRVRETGKAITPLVLEPQQRTVSNQSRPNISLFKEAIRQANTTVHNMSARAELEAGVTKLNLSEFDLVEQEPSKAFVLSWISKDPDQFYNVADPVAVSQIDDWIIQAPNQLATRNVLFANQLKRLIGHTINESETWEQMQKRLQEQANFEVLIDYPNIQMVPNLERYLGAVMRRKTLLEEQRDGEYVNAEDCDELMGSCQKAFESCFKYLLKKWPIQHKAVINQKWTKQELQLALKKIVSNILDGQTLKDLEGVKAGSVYYAANSQDQGVSLRPLIVATLFTLPTHSQHPFANMTPDELSLKSIVEISKERDQTSHASGHQIALEQAITHAQFTIAWVRLFTEKLG